MYKHLVAAVALSLSIPSISLAGDLKKADQAWKAGMPWPLHWSVAQYPYLDGWNSVWIGFVNRVYTKEEAAESRWLKAIPYAVEEGAAVELCTAKKGIFKSPVICRDALVDPTIQNTLKEEDIVAFFHARHSTWKYSDGPGTDDKSTLRIFQKLGAGDDDACWRSQLMIAHLPVTDECFARIDRENVSRLLTRDFGPKEGLACTERCSD